MRRWRPNTPRGCEVGKTAPDGECVIDGHWCWQRKNGLDWQLVGAVEAMRAFLRE